jgi:hypothetical protein
MAINVITNLSKIKRETPLRRLLRELMDTSAHGRLCDGNNGWGLCRCELAQAMRAAEKQVLKDIKAKRKSRKRGGTHAT